MTGSEFDLEPRRLLTLGSARMKITACVVTAFLILSSPGSFARPFKDMKNRVIEAEIKAVSGDNVTIIRNSDKREFTIPVVSLSLPDQEFIKTWVTEQKATPGAAMPEGEKPDESITPGAKFKIDFPDLKPDRRGEPAQVGVSIPSSYDPAKPTPIFIWMGGGDGGNGATDSGVVDSSKFILVGLPFPKGANNPGQSNMVGDFDTIWDDYHKPMLTEVFRRIPNIDKKLSIVGGFSNGAHCIAGVMQDAKDGGYPEFCNVFILVDGGNGDKRLKGGKGNFMFATWGEKSPNASRTEEAGKRASGMEVELFEMKDIGHQFAQIGKDKAKEWLESVVFPAAKGNGE